MVVDRGFRDCLEMLEKMELITHFFAKYNPLGKCRVLVSFVRIDFQYRGHPHVHMFLRLDINRDRLILKNKGIGYNTDR